MSTRGEAGLSKVQQRKCYHENHRLSRCILLIILYMFLKTGIPPRKQREGSDCMNAPHIYRHYILQPTGMAGAGIGRMRLSFSFTSTVAADSSYLLSAWLQQMSHAVQTHIFQQVHAAHSHEFATVCFSFSSCHLP